MAGGDDYRGGWPTLARGRAATLHLAGACHEGHPVGAVALAGHLRARDTITPRAGGGFAVALAGATPAEAATVAARLAAALGVAAWVATPAETARAGGLPVTAEALAAG